MLEREPIANPSAAWEVAHPRVIDAGPVRDRSQRTSAAASVSTSPRIRTISSNSAWPATSGRRDLDDGVTAVVRAADETGVEQRVREETADEPLALLLP